MRETLAGHDIWTVTQGQGDARLFVHCMLGPHQTLMPLAQALPTARDVFFDLPGHGLSSPWTGTQFQSDVVDIAMDLIDEPAHVIGHSFGATAALRLAVERPDLITRLTLIEPVMFAAARGSEAYEGHQVAMQPFVDAWQSGELWQAARAFTDVWGGGEPWEAITPRVRQQLIGQIHLIPATSPAIEDDVHNILGRLDRVTCHVDLIEGDQSQPIMPAIMDGLAAGLAQSSRHIIKGAGHMAPITHAHDVASALERG